MKSPSTEPFGLEVGSLPRSSSVRPLLRAPSSKCSDEEPFHSEPVQFEPQYQDRIWGGRRLHELLGRQLPAEGPFGESWEISTLPSQVSRVALGPYRRYLLSDLWKRHGSAIAGYPLRAGEEFPLLVKLLDCTQPVSVQVHPDDVQARRLLGQAHGKSEVWVVLDAQPQSRIYAGLKAGVNIRELRNGLRHGTVIELLRSFRPRVGQCVSIPAGTVHSMGPGLVLLEVQQPSDATFRLYDWDRLDASGLPRELHIELGLEAIDLSARPTYSSAAAWRSESRGPRQLLQTGHFELRGLTLTQPQDIRLPRTLAVVAVVDGEAVVRRDCGAFEQRIRSGDILLFPASDAAYQFSPIGRQTSRIVIVFPCQTACGEGETSLEH